MNIILLGHPGSGKGTESKLIQKKYGIPHISTGDIFRTISQEDTELGRRAKELIGAGDFVPDNITIQVVKERLSKYDCKKGIILDGFPRNLNQAKELDRLVKIDKVVHLHIEDETAVKRLSSRWQCKKCGIIYGINMMPKNNHFCDKCKEKLYQRDDDKPELLRKRIKIYHDETRLLIDYYKKKVIYFTVDGERGVEEVFEEVCKLLEK